MLTIHSKRTSVNQVITTLCLLPPSPAKSGHPTLGGEGLRGQSEGCVGIDPWGDHTFLRGLKKVFRKGHISHITFWPDAWTPAVPAPPLHWDKNTCCHLLLTEQPPEDVLVCLFLSVCKKHFCADARRNSYCTWESRICVIVSCPYWVMSE